MLNEAIILDEPTEMLSTRDLPYVDVQKSGEFFFTIASNTLAEGRKDVELRDGSRGHVKYVTLNGMCKDLRTQQVVGRMNLKVFLNTSNNYLASQLAALCSCFNKETGHSNLQPVRDQFNDGTEFWKIPQFNGRTVVVGVVRDQDYVRPSGEHIPQYSLAALLSEGFVNAAHFIKQKTDKQTMEHDWATFRRTLERAVQFKEERENQIATQAMAGGAGVSIYGAAAAASNPYLNGAARATQSAAASPIAQTAPATAAAPTAPVASAEPDEIPF